MRKSKNLGGGAKKKKPKKTLAAIRAARALRIYDQLRSKAPPGTFVVLANNRPAEQPGQSSNFLDVYHVARPRIMYHGSPADAASRKLSRHDVSKTKVRKAFGKAAKWMRYMTIYASDGQVQASIDLGDTASVTLAQPSSLDFHHGNPKTNPLLTNASADDTNNSISGYMVWLKKNWKLSAMIVVVVLLLVAGGMYWYFKR